MFIDYIIDKIDDEGIGSTDDNKWHVLLVSSQIA